MFLKDDRLVLLDPHGNMVHVPMSGEAELDGHGRLTIKNHAVRLAKIQKLKKESLLGNSRAEDEEAQEIKLGQGLIFNNGLLEATLLTTDPRFSDARTPIGTRLEKGKVLIGNDSDEVASVSISGDATVDSSGHLTLVDNSINNRKLQRINPESLLGNPTKNTDSPTEIKVGHGLQFNGNRLTISRDVCNGNDPRLFDSRSPIGTPLKGLLIGDSKGIAKDQQISGDITVDSGGVANIGSHKITYNHLRQVAPKSLLGNCEVGKTTDVTEIQLDEGLIFEDGRLRIDPIWLARFIRDETS